MKIWLSKNSEIPIRDQLTTQIVLGVASGDLPVGQKLPSTREISRRFGVHANTVAGAYQKLAEQGWLEFRTGSGFYVREAKTESIENSLDKIIAEFFQTAQKQGFSIAEIKERLLQFFAPRTANEILLIESDAEFREILVEELRRSTGFKISETSFENFMTEHCTADSIFVAMFDETAKIKAVVPPEKHCVFLKVRSVADAMKDEQKPTENDLIAVVSGWEKFLWLAKTMLVAARIDAESLIVRDTRRENWRNGLESASMVICDALTAKKLANFPNLRPFHLIADESLEELKRISA